MWETNSWVALPPPQLPSPPYLSFMANRNPLQIINVFYTQQPAPSLNSPDNTTLYFCFDNLCKFRRYSADIQTSRRMDIGSKELLWRLFWTKQDISVSRLFCTNFLNLPIYRKHTQSSQMTTYRNCEGGVDGIGHKHLPVSPAATLLREGSFANRLFTFQTPQCQSISLQHPLRATLGMRWGPCWESGQKMAAC